MKLALILVMALTACGDRIIDLSLPDAQLVRDAGPPDVPHDAGDGSVVPDADGSLVLPDAQLTDGGVALD